MMNYENKIKSIADLENLKKSILQAKNPDKIMVRICSSTGCKAGGCVDIFNAFSVEIAAQKLNDKIELKKVGCVGLCEQGPLLVFGADEIFYKQLTVDDVPEIVSESFAKSVIIDRLLYEDPVSKQKIPRKADIPFFKNQMRNVFGKTGVIDPENIEDYIAENGYFALCNALFSMSREQIIDEVLKSGLRGRGGGGFPTGKKWKICKDAASNIKYVVANGDEGDPGSYADLSLMEGDPHGILEGMIIGAYAIGASEGYFYVRGDYSLAIQRLENAIKQAEEYGFLGKNILGSGFDFTIKIKLGMGAFVCGEETALIASIMGKRGIPAVKPPFPVVSGLWGKPTNINNVKTYANIPLIIKNGASWFAGIGTEKSKGTTIFSIVGKTNNTGLVEMEMGVSLRDVIFKCAGGMKGNNVLKAVQTGGPAGACIPSELIDMSFDFDNLAKINSTISSGVITVMDESTCMVDTAHYFLAFAYAESCGKCSPCRIGLKVMLDILDRIKAGNGQEGDIEKLEEIGATVRDGSLCGLGKSATAPLLSMIHYFRNEYETHIKDKRCPALACKDLIKYVIDKEKCIGCGLCRKNCPVGAIKERKKKPHSINEDLCVKCGMCYQVCPTKIGAVKKVNKF